MRSAVRTGWPICGGSWTMPWPDLTALGRELAAVTASCQGGAIAECRFIEASAPAVDDRV